MRGMLDLSGLFSEMLGLQKQTAILRGYGYENGIGRFSAVLGTRRRGRGGRHCTVFLALACSLGCLDLPCRGAGCGPRPAVRGRRKRG